MKFIINEKEYNSMPIEFGTIIDLEDLGIGLEDFGEKKFVFMRAYFMLCARNKNKDFIGNEMQEHFMKTGNFDKLGEAIGFEIESSAFFRKLQEKETANAPDGEEQKTEEETAKVVKLKTVKK